MHVGVRYIFLKDTQRLYFEPTESSQLTSLLDATGAAYTQSLGLLTLSIGLPSAGS
jgi:hypothetical protein